MQCNLGEKSYTRTDSSRHSLCVSKSSDADKPFQPSINYSVLVRKSKGSTFNILCLHGIYHLDYCTSRHKAFCFFCYKACRLKLINGNKRQKDPFVSAGFNNWKNPLQEYGQS